MKTMALRNYMLNLLSDCAQTNETCAAEMCVTIVNDNYFQSDAASIGSPFPAPLATNTRKVSIGESNANDEMYAAPKPSPVLTMSQGTPGRGSPPLKRHLQQPLDNQRTKPNRLRSPIMCSQSISSTRGSDGLPRLILE